MTTRYHVPSYGADTEKLKLTLAHAVEIAKTHDSDITLIVPTLKDAPNTILKDLMPSKTIKAMTKGERTTINGVKVKLTSINTFDAYRENGVIVSLWLRDNAIAKTDDAYDAKAIIALNWGEGTLEQWLSTHCPEEIA